MFKIRVTKSNENIDFYVSFSTQELANDFIDIHKIKAGDGFLYTIIEEQEEVVPTISQAQLDSNAAKAYLARTDYVALKLAEAIAEGNQSEVDALKVTYATQLAERKVQRTKVI